MRTRRPRLPLRTMQQNHLGHGDIIRLLRGCGLDVEDLLAPARARRYDAASAGHPGMGAAMAMRRSLEGPQTLLSQLHRNGHLKKHAPVGGAIMNIAGAHSHDRKSRRVRRVACLRSRAASE